jgi:hypothetical protein
VTLLRRHRGLAILLALLVPATIAFCWHGVIDTLADDSVSYITVARWLWPFGRDALLMPWVGYYSHFPPVFPALLVLTGGAWNFLAAHVLVACCALLAVVMAYFYGALRLGSLQAGLGLAIVFVLLPSAWISILSILSEPLYLALSLAAIVYHGRHEEDGEARPVVLGLLFAAVFLTRVAGVALLAAYAMHLAIRSMAGRRWPSKRSIAPLAIALGFQLLWIVIRPAVESRGYQTDLGTILKAWFEEPARVSALSWSFLSGGWTASFSADADVSLSMRTVFAIVAVLGLAGAIRGALRNRLDSWYVLASAAMLALWVFETDNQRRLIYPLLPLVLVHAGEVVQAVGRRLVSAQLAYLPLLAGAGLVVAFSLPGTLLVAQKAMDRAPLVEGFGYSLSAMTTYYTAVNLKSARIAGQQSAAVLAGLQMMERATPPAARIMWTRPEYVAVLGRRQGVPWHFSWDRATLAREIQRSGTTHVIASRIFKPDLAGQTGDAYAAFAVDTPEYLHLAYAVPNPGSGAVEFALLEVDAERLKAALAAQAR